MTRVPVPPKSLNPFARELLERLAGHEEAAEIVIGGGVALSHYLEHRGTVDLDAWWLHERKEGVLMFVEECMKAMTEKYGLNYRCRQWGETGSLELLRSGQKLFAVIHRSARHQSSVDRTYCADFSAAQILESGLENLENRPGKPAWKTGQTNN